MQTFGYSFTNWTGQSPTFDFVGVDNYTALMKDEVFRGALWNNLLLLVFVPVVTILLALFFAFMVNAGGRGGAGGVQGVRGSGFYKIVYFFPQVLSLAILAVLFGAVYRTDEGGLLNGVLIRLGLVDRLHPVEWLNEPAARALVPAPRGRLARRRLLPRAVLGGHAVRPQGHLRGRPARRPARPDLLQGHPAPLWDSVQSPRSTWASPRWTCSSWCRP
ncbi:hypothetical protein SAVIM40S_07015 [Streptomyces avidinii]